MDWGAVGSVGAMLVALVALGAAIFEGRATRRHNRLSVRPLLRIDYAETGITLHNTGAGPAILNTFEVFVDGEEVECEIDDLPAIAAAETLEMEELLTPSDSGDGVFYAYMPDPGNSLMAQEKVGLLTFPALPQDGDDRFELWERLLRITFRIRYASVYGEENTFPVSSSPAAPAPSDR